MFNVIVTLKSTTIVIECATMHDALCVEAEWQRLGMGTELTIVPG